MSLAITTTHCECLADGCQYAKRVEHRDAEIERLRAALQRLLDWNEGIAAGRGNHYPREHADVARAALGHQQPRGQISERMQSGGPGHQQTAKTEK